MNPLPVERLEKTLARVAKEQGLAQERLRRWVSFLALCGVLERAVSEGVLDNYYLKGGAAMELRFAESARATKDIDIGVSGERAARLALFQNALALGFDDFSFRLKGKPLNMEKVDAVRLELAIQYRSRAWQTIDVDLGAAGAGVVDLVEPTIRGLSAMGLRTPSPVRCLNLSEQVTPLKSLSVKQNDFGDGFCRGLAERPSHLSRGSDHTEQIVRRIFYCIHY